MKSKKYSKKATYILLAKDLSFIDKRELGTLKKDIAEVERILKATINSFENKHLTPGILGPSSPAK